LCSDNCNVLGKWVDIFENMGDTSTVVIEMKKIELKNGTINP